eukprot:gnl/MRDRNA2_/MRDRNA2_90164_c0_seq1.p1 gnl/MRDRNA2_/MRDRNA2_90164_c0~~gnl/MRDRNA2_/MRDRNA2_90164_c0_seq1.p1  ORF type:complete len:428 (-),score=159.16 gnl/MRDRNA2_/MRDRNA2_90164_c0_seq1:61-1344(-)
MKVLLFFSIFTFSSAARTVEKAKGGPGTQTVLLIKGGVGFDVNLLSTTPQTKRLSKGVKPKEHAIESEAAELEGEQKVASDLTLKLQNTVDASKKLEQQVRNLKARTLKAEKRLSEKDDEIKKLQQKEAEKDKSLQVKNKMLLHERHENELLKKKVGDLEQDIEVSNHAWKEAADHEKEVAEEAKEEAKQEAAKNDRLSQQMSEKKHKKVPAAAPKVKPSHDKFMKSLKKQSVKLAKAAKDDVEPVIDTLDAMPSADEMQQQESVDEADAEDIEAQTQVPADDEEMPVAEDSDEEAPVKEAQETVVNPPMVHGMRNSADVESVDGTDATASASPEAEMTPEADTEDSSMAGPEAEKGDESDWNLAYSPADSAPAYSPDNRAASVEESVEGDVDKQADVLSPNAADVSVEDDPDDPVPAKPDYVMGRV